MKSNHTEEIGKLAATLSLIEIGLGSLLHSFKIPLSGQILSINQIGILSRASFKLKSHKAPLQISLATAVLKSLSPAGKKLTPMLAIAAQGLFFYLGVFVFGVNYVGLFFAVLFSSLWAFAQPILFIYLLFGKNSLAVAEYFIHEFEKIIPLASKFIIWILIGSILIKFILAFVLSLIAIKVTEQAFDKYQQKMLLEVKLRPPSSRTAVILAFRDLLNPLFIFSFLMTTLFFIFSNSDPSNVKIIWSLLRPLAVGYIIFYLIRIYPLENISAFLHRKRFNQLGQILDSAIKIINQSLGR